MKVLKIVLLIAWGIITIGLILYSQSLKVESERNKNQLNKSIEILNEMTVTHGEYYKNMLLLRNDSLHKLDIDSLFENSVFLSTYEKKLQNVNK